VTVAEQDRDRTRNAAVHDHEVGTAVLVGSAIATMSGNGPLLGYVDTGPKLTGVGAAEAVADPADATTKPTATTTRTS
jgi:hypothetical protein